MASPVCLVRDDLRISTKGYHHPRRGAVLPCYGRRLWYHVAHLWAILVAAQCGDSIQTLAAAALMRPRAIFGALHEVLVAAAMIRAGFELKLENEEDGSETHCEFTAI